MNGTWSDPVAWAALAPAFALAGALVNGLFGRRLREPLPGILASVAVAAAFAVSLVAFVGLLGRDGGVSLTLWSFLQIGRASCRGRV